MNPTAFHTELDTKLLDDDSTWCLVSPLVFDSKIVGRVVVPAGFQTDFASVPRLPIVYTLYGNRAHRESVIHDYLFRKDSEPLVGFMAANRVFLEAMECRGKAAYIRYPMFWGVCLGSFLCFHKRKVMDILYQKKESGV